MSVSIVAVGDVSLGDSLVCASFGVDSMLCRTPGMSPFEHVRSTLRDGDVVFGNLETVLSDDGLEERDLASMQMRGRKGYVQHLVDAGFTVMSMANNHILQHGRKAYEDTVALVESNGIAVAGKTEANGRSCKPASSDINGKRIVFLSYEFEEEKFFSRTTLYAYESA